VAVFVMLTLTSITEEILDLKERIQVTSIVVTHDRDLAFGVADRLALMNEGKIIAIGTAEEVRRSPDPLVQRFLTVDFKPQTKAAV